MHERTTDVKRERYARECCRYNEDNRGDVALPCMTYTHERAGVLGEKFSNEALTRMKMRDGQYDHTGDYPPFLGEGECGNEGK